MEDVSFEKTRGGNPKYTHVPTGIKLYLTQNTQQEGKGNASLYIGAKELKAIDLTGKQSDEKKHDVRLSTVSYDEHYPICQAYLSQIKTLHKLGMKTAEICAEIYTSIKGSKEPEIELNQLIHDFYEVNCNFKCQLETIKDEIVELEHMQEVMENICKEMEML